ncbi:MAG TPA: 2-oxoglutarate dehydrogenase complex dihydrolipoyllysine-residue succinyltransferase [Planctomycetota bacterium]|nr:2-oxoglutarate dehydrogenase complex dihydrolipoyllysine-residue succinyltransferase [Planctomycetota bacterium]
MPTTVKIPAVGESITEGILSRWLVADGARVDANTPLFELETDKITTEVQAGTTGTARFLVKEGETLPIGTVVAEIEPVAPGTPDDVPTTGRVAAPPPSPSAAPKPKADATAQRPKSEPAKARNDTLSPAVRRVVDEAKLDPAKIAGSGKDGLILKADAQAEAERARHAPSAPPAPAAAPPAGADANGVTRKRMSSLRQKIASRLVAAQHTAAILTTFNEIDMSFVMDLRKRHKEEFEKKLGVGLGFMSFFTVAACRALAKFPLVNSQIDNGDIVSFDHVDMGIAVGTEKGLVVPVLRGAEKMSFVQIEGAIRGYAAKARDGKLTLDDLQGGTFTITNGGVYGSLMSTPIINPPQSAILGMHAIKERPIAVNGQVVIRPMMYVALSYDHRIIDGAEAVGFLVRVKELIESPEKLLLGL